jgi:uncharacterized membrane protein YphA (DoxX/SURF4 family)
MKPAQFTTLVIVSLVALRLACGWLFFREGSKKLDSGTFTSSHFLRDAEGPLDDAYLAMVPDALGGVRLSAEETRQRWDRFQTDAGAHFGFSKEQKILAKLTAQRAVAGLRGYLNDIGNEYREHLREIERLRKVEERKDPTADVNYRSTWLERETARQDAQLAGWLGQAEELWNTYERDINAIATTDQMAKAGYFELPRASSSFVDKVIPWFTFIVGVLLVLGLFTRVAAVGGAAFLLSVISTQPPWAYAAADTNYQVIVMLALLVIAAVGAGRWGGLDFFLGWCCSGCCRRTPAENPPAKGN